MIDLITLTKQRLTDTEIQSIVEFNKLQTNTKAGKVYYNNVNTKNISDGFFLQIEINKRLKLSASLHKYKNWTTNKGFVNYDLFTMQEAEQSAYKLLSNTGLDLNELNVYSYEIGMNLYLPQDCRIYLDSIESIGVSDSKKDFWVNPKFKNERLKTTYLYREVRKIFKAYDKNFEMIEKRRTEDTGHINILRIETVFNRVERMPLVRFLSTENLLNMTNRFIKDWRTIHFKIYTVVPPGTSTLKRELCNSILTSSPETVLNNAKVDLSSNRITPKQYRRIREFIQHEWNSFKKLITVEQSPEEKEFRKALKETFTLLK